MIGRVLSNYGMVGVLLLLCAYYSYATMAQQVPVGATAATAAVKAVKRDTPPPATVLVIAGLGDDDQRFATAATAQLRTAGYTVADTVVGTPREAKASIRKLSAAGTRVAAIVAAPDMAASPVFDDVGTKFPAFAGVHVRSAAPYRWPTFLMPDNLLQVASQIAVIAIIAIGMTLVILTGGIDLSVGSLVALSAVVTGLWIRNHGGATASTATMVVAAAVGIAVCTAIGLVAGGLITAFRLPPFIATLGFMQIASGMAYILAHGASIYEIPDRFTWLGRSASLAGIPNAVVLMVVLFAVAHVVMTRTTYGRYVYAVGGNAEAARLSGVRVGAVLVSVYALSAATAGLGGVVLASQLKSGDPTYGLSYELYVIAAVVVGGTSLTGGEGRVVGTLVGALIYEVIQNGMNLTGIDSYHQKVVLGVLIVAAVLLDTLKRRPFRRPVWLRRGFPVSPLTGTGATSADAAPTPLSDGPEGRAANVN